jgi:hypothetical protein
MSSCACGCAQTFERKMIRGHEQRYIHGHNERGKKHDYFIKKSGKDHPNWKGGRIRTNQGYYLLYLPDHPLCESKGYVLEHRYVWEQYNIAILLPWAEVHHKDKNRDNNNIDNLEAMTYSQHLSLHKRGIARMTEHRICANCLSDKTFMKRSVTGEKIFPFWYILDRSNGFYLCHNCYQRRQRHLAKS